MNKNIYYLIGFFILFSFSCKEKTQSECKVCDEELKQAQQTEKEALVMYEPSELATLMLEMYAENQDWKAEIKKGNIPKSFPEKYKNMHKAQSVNEYAGSEFYNAMSDTYLKSIKDLTEASPENAKERYNKMVNICLQCHQEICPGPIPKINKLILE